MNLRNLLFTFIKVNSNSSKKYQNPLYNSKNKCKIYNQRRVIDMAKTAPKPAGKPAAKPAPAKPKGK